MLVEQDKSEIDLVSFVDPSVRGAYKRIRKAMRAEHAKENRRETKERVDRVADEDTK